MKWISVAAAVVLIVACFMEWIVVESRSIVVSGVDATGTSFGKPGYMHLLMTALFLVCTFIPRVWAKRWNLAVVAINLGWALRNYFVISVCRGGECPTKKTGLYLVMLCSVLMLLGAMFTDIKVPDEKEDSPPVVL